MALATTKSMTQKKILTLLYAVLMWLGGWMAFFNAVGSKYWYLWLLNGCFLLREFWKAKLKFEELA